MTTAIKRCRGETKIVGFTKKKMIPESEISEYSECDVKSKWETYLSMNKYLENFVLRFTKFIFIFTSITKN